MLTKESTCADRINQALQQNNIKKIDLANITGYSRGSITNWCNGVCIPKDTAIHKLAMALNVSEMWLWGYDVSPERTDWQKANDRLVDITVRLKTDPDFAKLVLLADSLPAEKLPALESVLNALLT